jgi:hypothetical protein
MEERESSFTPASDSLELSAEKREQSDLRLTEEGQ